MRSNANVTVTDVLAQAARESVAAVPGGQIVCTGAGPVPIKASINLDNARHATFFDVMSIDRSVKVPRLNISARVGDPVSIVLRVSATHTAFRWTASMGLLIDGVPSRVPLRDLDGQATFRTTATDQQVQPTVEYRNGSGWARSTYG